MDVARQERDAHFPISAVLLKLLDEGAALMLVNARIPVVHHIV